MPSIGQYNQIVKNLVSHIRYKGKDQNGNPIYDSSVNLPVISCSCSEKLHGTNMGICYSHVDGFWVQSKENIITPVNDNAAAAFHAYKNEHAWLRIIYSLADTYSIDLSENIITVYSEWCGQGIQKKSAASGLDKMAVIFEYFKVSPLVNNFDSDQDPAKWYPTNCIDDPKSKIYNIGNFPKYYLDIDFSNPKKSQNEMISIVEKIIEPASPFGKTFGKEDNIGEGIVVSFMYSDQLFQFKVKGEKHAGSKVKTLKKVDDEKLQSIQELAQYVTPAWRLEQMYQQANNTLNGELPDIQNLGKFMKLLNCDIIKEESDTISEAGLEPKEIFGSVGRIAREWYKEQLDRDIMIDN